MNKYGDKLTDKAYDYAKKYNLKITEGTKGWNDEGDAFRHAFMQASLSVKSTTGLSKVAGDFHEYQGDKDNHQDGREKNMDLWNNDLGRKIGEDIKREYNFSQRTAMIKNGQMDDVIADKIVQKIRKGELITSPADSRKYVETPKDTRTPGQKFSDEIRAEHNRRKNADYQRIFGRAKSNSSANSPSGRGNGRWVTMNGRHVFLEG